MGPASGVPTRPRPDVVANETRTDVDRRTVAVKRPERRGHLVVMSPVAPEAVIERSDVRLAIDGDEAAFARLVSAYHADMARVAYVITGDGELAKDAVQTAWVNAWRRLSSIRNPDDPRAWLVSIAANEARQIVRRRRRVTIVEIDPELGTAPARSDPATGIDRLDLIRALDGLPAADRALLAMRYVGGLDATELGSLTGRTAGGIRARLSRLTARLREDLGDV